MADWGIRPASAADVEAVAELRAVVLRADLERLGVYDDHRVRQRLRDAFVPAHTWVIEVGGAFAGCVALRPADDAHWLEHFYLAPHLQGSGIGTAVLRGLLDQCDRDGAVVRLNVLQGSAARRLYERHGFTLETEDPVDVFMVREPAWIGRFRWWPRCIGRGPHIVSGMTDAQRWVYRADELADRGGHDEEVERLLRDAVAVGHGPAFVRLAGFLWDESGRDRQDILAEVEELLSRAVGEGVPGAANYFGLLLADIDQDGRAEEMLRRAIAEGDPDAATNLAAVLHGRGADRAAYDVLVSAARGGDDFAYQILGANVDRADPVWAEITEDWSAARSTDQPPIFFCYRRGAYRLRSR